MRNTRDRWCFFHHPSRPVLSPEDVAYFRRNLPRILKVGMEFEFNLPDKTGSCKGKSSTCPCMHMHPASDCWIQCAKQEQCLNAKQYGSCGQVTKKCKPTDCAECDKYKFHCSSIHCVTFVPACYSCGLHEINCNECSHKYNPKLNPDNIRKTVTSELSPSQTYGIINKSGVHSIVKDGSLLGNKGMEVITTGRRVDYWEFFRMANNIIKTSVDRGAYINERCSIHMHVLTSYYQKMVEQNENHGVPNRINELERDIPEIVLANFHQLCRRYQNALTWMTMALDDPKRMTRWEKFRVSILEISAMLNKMPEVSNQVENNSGGNKYGWANYKYTQYSHTGDISRFHVELRVMDGVLSPSIVAAIGCLYYALVIKAVEISRYGLLEVGDEEWMIKAKEVKSALLNNMKSYSDGDRWGNTKRLHKYYDILIKESLELVHQLKHILIAVGPAYQVLEQLAEKPAALRRCDGQSWEEIEASFAVPMSSEGIFEAKINEYIDLRMVTECQNVGEWIEEISTAFQEDSPEDMEIPVDELPEHIKVFVENKRDDGEIIWSTTLGTVVRI